MTLPHTKLCFHKYAFAMKKTPEHIPGKDAQIAFAVTHWCLFGVSPYMPHFLYSLTDLPLISHLTFKFAVVHCILGFFYQYLCCDVQSDYLGLGDKEQHDKLLAHNPQ